MIGTAKPRAKRAEGDTMQIQGLGLTTFRSSSFDAHFLIEETYEDG